LTGDKMDTNVRAPEVRPRSSNTDFNKAENSKNPTAEAHRNSL